MLLSRNAEGMEIMGGIIIRINETEDIKREEKQTN